MIAVVLEVNVLLLIKQTCILTQKLNFLVNLKYMYMVVQYCVCTSV